ncbi:hypothetical protein LX86_002286 [Lentzea aerocolonigenes]|nr:hypothetical protein [Lentzea aerocolonigenes]
MITALRQPVDPCGAQAQRPRSQSGQHQDREQPATRGEHDVAKALQPGWASMPRKTCEQLPPGYSAHDEPGSTDSAATSFAGQARSARGLSRQPQRGPGRACAHAVPVPCDGAGARLRVGCWPFAAPRRARPRTRWRNRPKTAPADVIAIAASAASDPTQKEQSGVTEHRPTGWLSVDHPRGTIMIVHHPRCAVPGRCPGPRRPHPRFGKPSPRDPPQCPSNSPSRHLDRPGPFR